MRLFHLSRTLFLFALVFSFSNNAFSQAASCFAPGNTIVDDTFDITILPHHDIGKVHVAEPFFGDGSQKLVFSLDVEHLRYNLPVLTLPVGTWNVIFTDSGGTSRYVQMSTLLGNPRFTHGTVTNLLGIPVYNHIGDIQGAFEANGRVTLYVDKNLVGNPANGALLMIGSRTYLNTAGVGLVEMDQSLSVAYNVQGSGTCAPFRFLHWGMNGDVPVTNDYTRNGTSDYAVWRPDTGDWYTTDSVTGAFNVFNLGTGVLGDIPVPGDYDLDGKGDHAVYRPSTGMWIIHRTETNDRIEVRFGLEEDMPLSGDFDGDRVDDIAVFRPSSGTWFILNSMDGSVRIQSFGLNEDRPFAGDFDGDRRADIGVFRPSTGAWYASQSSDGGVLALYFGLGTDVIVPADYDGDGKTDVAVWRPETGYWYWLRRSTGTLTAVNWGVSTDRVQPGDYNGNGRSDFAVWRPESGDWYIYSN